ncbi:MAG: hypothetical protein ACXWQO_15665 [Bdellovibrionota bacterium]
MESIASLFFSSLLALSAFPHSAHATTFGPIPLTGQVRETQYFAHGKILSNGTPAMEPTLKRPYTYWKFSLIDQPAGAPLPGQFDIREAGGEIGQMGYHVASSASFRQGEEVFVALKDTDQATVKQVVGLSSGKYTVADDGKSLVSGLGPTVMGPDNMPLTPEEFTQVLRRAASGRETARDKTIFVNRGPHAGEAPEHGYEDNPVSANSEREAAQLMAKGENNMLKGTQISAPQNNSNTANPVKNSPEIPEKFSTGTSSGFWWISALFAIALVAFIAVILRR